MLLGLKPFEKSSRFTREYQWIRANEKTVVEWLLKNAKRENEKVVLFPTDDRTAAIIDKNQDVLRAFFHFPHICNSPGKVVEWMNKSRQKELARKIGIPVAQEYAVLNGDKNWEKAVSEVCYPCFSKPEISINGHKSLIRECHNEKDLKQVIEKAGKYSDCPVMIEEYMRIDAEYGILGFSNGKESVIPGIVEKTLVGSDSHVGVTVTGTYRPFESDDPLKNKLERMIAEIGFTGLFDIDLYKNGDTVYFNELNFRLGAFGFASFHAGINLPEMLVLCLSGRDYGDRNRLIRKPVACISEKANLDEFASGNINWETYLGNRKRAEYGFIEWEQDLAPFRLFQKHVQRKKIWNDLKHFIHRG